MKRYEVFPGHAGSPLQMAEFEPAALGDRQVAVAIKAVSLNYRDILVTQNTYFCPITDGLVPCSDGAGEVVALVLVRVRGEILRRERQARWVAEVVAV